MLTKFFSSFAAPAQKPVASVPPGERIYSIGDIHGRLDLLDDLLDSIDADSASRQPAKVSIIFLGDLIDRGPSSAQVVERLLQLAKARPETRFLLGNHEEVLLGAFSGNEKYLRLFTKIGGRETLLSYGVTEEQYRELDYPELFSALKSLIPQTHIDFLSSFEDLIVIGEYAFVHAGVRPNQPLSSQQTSDLRWIRNEFLNHRGVLEKVIVHGHTITEEIEIRSNRIGLDTGAYASGKLSAMGFEADRRWVLNTG
jgi:serine/threonine protein phosphatase 1